MGVQLLCWKVKANDEAVTKASGLRFTNGDANMFKSIFNQLSICLEGTWFRRKHKPKSFDRHIAEESENAAPCHNYVLTTSSKDIKKDIISKLQGADSRLVERRVSTKKGRAKWCPNLNEQSYGGPKAGVTLDPKIEVYWRALGLANAQEPPPPADW